MGLARPRGVTGRQGGLGVNTKLAWYALAVMVIIAAVAVACAAPARTIESVDGVVWRWHDPDHAVTCWLNAKGGLSCLPDAAFE